MRNVKFRYLLLLLAALTFSGCDTKNEFDNLLKDYFIKFYGEDGDQQGIDMIVNSDGTMVLLGNSTSADGVSKIFLVKVNTEGNIIWQKTFATEGENAVDIEKNLDGNFIILSNIITGRNAVTGANEYKIHLTKITPDGEVMKDFEFGSLISQYGNTITPITNAFVPEGGFMVSGYTTDIEDGIEVDGIESTDLIILLVDAALDNAVWPKPLRIKNQLSGEAIKVFESKTYDDLVKNGDRPFYVFGYSDDADFSSDYENNLLCLSLKANGGPSDFSAISYAGTPQSQERMSQTIEDHGFGFISVGTQTIAANQQRLVIARSEVDGNGLHFISNSFKVVEGDRNLKAVSITKSIAGGRYLILSNEKHPTGTTNLWLSKVDIDGRLNWSASFGSITKNDFSGTVRELDNGKIVILGTVELESQNSKMALIKVNANGELLD